MMQNSFYDNPQFSPLLATLGWIEHAFLPAGKQPPAECVYARQRHSPQVILDTEAVPVKSRDADGVIGTGQHPVAVYTADCLPILIADDRQYHVAAVHAGLKGAMAGVLFSAVDRLLALGATPDSLHVAIGPAIGPCCYELGEDVVQAMRENPLLVQTPHWQRTQPLNPQAIRPQAQATHQGVWFDLPKLAQQMLQQLGVPPSRIDIVRVCTYCMAEAQSSYRRNTHFAEGYKQRFSWIQCRN